LNGWKRPHAEYLEGNLDIREFEDGEWTGGCYATYENLIEKVKEALEE